MTAGVEVPGNVRLLVYMINIVVKLCHEVYTNYCSFSEFIIKLGEIFVNKEFMM